jgi:hypothetical protein
MKKVEFANVKSTGACRHRYTLKGYAEDFQEAHYQHVATEMTAACSRTITFLGNKKRRQLSYGGLDS